MRKLIAMRNAVSGEVNPWSDDIRRSRFKDLTSLTDDLNKILDPEVDVDGKLKTNLSPTLFQLPTKIEKAMEEGRYFEAPPRGVWDGIGSLMEKTLQMLPTRNQEAGYNSIAGENDSVDPAVHTSGPGSVVNSTRLSELDVSIANAALKVIDLRREILQALLPNTTNEPREEQWSNIQTRLEALASATNGQFQNHSVVEQLQEAWRVVSDGMDSQHDENRRQRALSIISELDPQIDHAFSSPTAAGPSTDRRNSMPGYVSPVQDSTAILEEQIQGFLRSMSHPPEEEQAQRAFNRMLGFDGGSTGANQAVSVSGGHGVETSRASNSTGQTRHGPTAYRIDTRPPADSPNLGLDNFLSCLEEVDDLILKVYAEATPISRKKHPMILLIAEWKKDFGEGGKLALLKSLHSATVAPSRAIAAFEHFANLLDRMRGLKLSRSGELGTSAIFTRLRLPKAMSVEQRKAASEVLKRGVICLGLYSKSVLSQLRDTESTIDQESDHDFSLVLTFPSFSRTLWQKGKHSQKSSHEDLGTAVARYISVVDDYATARVSVYTGDLNAES